MLSEYKLNMTAQIPFLTRPGGVLGDADSLPTCGVFRNALTTATLTPTVVKVDDGHYIVSFAVSTANGFAVGDTVYVVVYATLDGVADAEIVGAFVVTPVVEEVNAIQIGGEDATLDEEGVTVATGGIGVGAFATGAIDNAALADGAISNGKLADGTLTAAKIAAQALTAAKFAADVNLQSGDAYAIVNNGTYGNARLVRATTPANTLDVAATGEVGLDFANIKQATGATTLTNITVPVVTSTGAVTGAVGSVTGNVGGSVASVTGAVGSVTGNVGGNVVGSVASVTGNIGGSVASVTGNVGGNLVGSIGSLSTQAKADVNAEADAALADYDGPTNAELTARTLASASYATASALSTVSSTVGTINTNVSAVKGKTDSLAFTITGRVDATVAGYGTGLDPATMVLDADRGDHDIPDSIGEAIQTGGGGGTIAPTVSEIVAGIDADSTRLAAIVADTAELQGDWANGGRLDLLLDGLTAGVTVTSNQDKTGYSLNLSQTLGSDAGNTVGGALHASWIGMFGKIVQNRVAKTLTMFGWNGTAAQVHDLDDGDQPTSRTPRA